jgi:hypothetical protein
MLERIQSLAEDTRDEALAGLSHEESDTLMRLLARVHGNLSNREPSGSEGPESAFDRQDVDDDHIQ